MSWRDKVRHQSNVTNQRLKKNLTEVRTRELDMQMLTHFRNHCYASLYSPEHRVDYSTGGTSH